MDWLVDALLDLRVVDDAQVDPTGQRVAFVVAESTVGVRAPGPASRIWFVDVHGDAEPVQLTHGPGTDDLPRWSPDATMLAFRSDRAKRGTGQLYLLRGGWQEATLLYEFPSGIQFFAWSPDGRSIAVIASDPPAKRAEGDDHILYEEERRFARIWLVDVASGEARCLTSDPIHVWEFAWAPDGASLAALVSELPYAWSWYGAELVRIDVESGARTTLYAPERQLTRPVWSPDGGTVAVISSTWSDPGMTGGDVILVPADGGELRNLTANEPRSYLSLHWCRDGRLLAAALDRNRAAICLLDPAGTVETRWSGEHFFNSYGISASADGRVIAATISSPTEPVELWIAHMDGTEEPDVTVTRRTHFNAGLPVDALAPYETLTWTGHDGLEIEGLLARPRTGDEEPWPLVVLIHGGPTGTWPYGIRSSGTSGWVHLLAAQGCAVLMPNPRGSAGYGLAFAEANHGDLGGADLDDILRGVDHCIELGIADPERLGVGGWSYGGYLTTGAITQTDRFNAAVAGATISNWYSFHGGTNIPRFDEIFLRANPYALDGPYAARSPIFFVDRVQTPTLFLHGAEDPCCPVGQATEMSRGLRAHGVETQCVIYPREPHGIRERAHQRDVLRRAVDWFITHLSR